MISIWVDLGGLWCILSPFFSSHFLSCLSIFLLYLAFIVFLLIVVFGAASIDEPQGSSGSPPVVFSMHCKM